MDIKPIRTPADHTAALKEIERLWDKARPGTPEGDTFDVLAALVDAYEREHFEIPAPDPIAAIRFRMDQKRAHHQGSAADLQDARTRFGDHGQETTAQPRNDPTAACPTVDSRRVPRAGLQAQGRWRANSPSLIPLRGSVPQHVARHPRRRGLLAASRT